MRNIWLIAGVIAVGASAIQACSSDARQFGTGAAGAGGSPNSGGSMSGAGTAGKAPAGSCEPGDSEACYESPDGMSYGEIPALAVGSCKIGVRTCASSSTWSTCVGAVPPGDADSCDAGNDENCNGTPNEGCPCTAGATRDCGSGVGECLKGKQTCTDTAWSSCVGETIALGADTCEPGNDANCDGSPNTGCECLNGTTAPCGKNTGNCQEGEKSCVNGVWGACVGEIEQLAKDACDPAGDDANCNGAPNEGCACTAGASRDCMNCGTQTCKGDGTWNTSCTDPGECSEGDVDTDTVACGNCGEQSRRRTCSATCEWGAWQDVGGCLGSGPCKPGTTADLTQEIGCGNCNTGKQQQKKTCTTACDWPATWTNVGSCTGQGCSPGSKQAESSVSCGYCDGSQARERVCSQSCAFGPIVNKGGCVQLSCSNLPNDERVGYVTCFNDWPDMPALVCTDQQECCLTAQSSYECKGACVASDKTVNCDGPEDCGGSLCCLIFNVDTQSSYGQCGTVCEFDQRRCHSNADCAPPSICLMNNTTVSGGYNGRCN